MLKLSLLEQRLVMSSVQRIDGVNVFYLCVFLSSMKKKSTSVWLSGMESRGLRSTTIRIPIDNDTRLSWKPITKTKRSERAWIQTAAIPPRIIGDQPLAGSFHHILNRPETIVWTVYSEPAVVVSGTWFMNAKEMQKRSSHVFVDFLC